MPEITVEVKARPGDEVKFLYRGASEQGVIHKVQMVMPPDWTIGIGYVIEFTDPDYKGSKKRINLPAGKFELL